MPLPSFLLPSISIMSHFTFLLSIPVFSFSWTLASHLELPRSLIPPVFFSPVSLPSLCITSHSNCIFPNSILSRFKDRWWTEDVCLLPGMWLWIHWTQKWSSCALQCWCLLRREGMSSFRQVSALKPIAVETEQLHVLKLHPQHLLRSYIVIFLRRFLRFLMLPFPQQIATRMMISKKTRNTMKLCFVPLLL